ncbi:MAG: PDZ domain-containing protein, partial [Rodentibacter sp.]
SLAAQRGLKAGDIIIGVNRQAVKNTQDLRKVLEDKPSAVALNILRGNSNFYLLVQ